jgi:hypothetical protein
MGPDLAPPTVPSSPPAKKGLACVTIAMRAEASSRLLSRKAADVARSCTKATATAVALAEQTVNPPDLATALAVVHATQAAASLSVTTAATALANAAAAADATQAMHDFVSRQQQALPGALFLRLVSGPPRPPAAAAAPATPFAAAPAHAAAAASTGIPYVPTSAEHEDVTTSRWHPQAAIVAAIAGAAPSTKRPREDPAPAPAPAPVLAPERKRPPKRKQAHAAPPPPAAAAAQAPPGATTPARSASS